MYTELVKIIEGGLKGDKERVYSYSKVLAENLEKDGDLKFANRINNLLSNSGNRLVGLDSFTTKPVDQESRMDIVNISMPKKPDDSLIFDKFIESEVDDFIKTFNYSDLLQQKGIDINNTLLLYGPPGCGKTSLSRYISYKLNMPLVTARFDSLLSSLLGNTAKNIRKIFEYAEKSPCILLIDEFDAVAKVRDDKNELGELKRVVNSLLQNLDEFSSKSILIAATNHHELLDPAIWRRFHKVIELKKPSDEIIRQLLKLYTSKYDIGFFDNLKKSNLMVEAFKDFSPADVKSVVYTAIKKSLMNGIDKIEPEQILYEVYLFKKHMISDEKDIICFLNNYGIPQRKIVDFLKISSRQVSETLIAQRKEDDGDA